MEIDIKAEIAAATDKIDSSMKKGFSRMERRWFPRRIAGSVITTGAGTFSIDFGSPSIGKLWNPVAVAVFGAPPTFALPTITRAVFTIGDLANAVPSQVVQVLEGTTDAGFSSTFGTEALWGYPSENAFVQCVATGVTTVYATLQIREYNQDDIEPRFA